MRLSQIIAEADDHVNYDGLDPSIIERLSEYKSHQQQWAVKELKSGGDINSVVDALDYYIAKIGDNRFQNILKPRTPAPKNILSLSLGDIKAAQHDFETRYNSLSKRERERLKSNIVLDTPDLKVVEFKKSGADDVDTAKALAAAAQFTNWCVVNTETGNDYLNKGPIYLITMDEAEYETVVPGGQPVATNQYLCHIASNQLMDVWDQEKKLPERVCLKLREYINGVGIFCDDKSSDVYVDVIKHSPQLASQHACYVIRGRWPQAEPTIIQDPQWAYHYACYVIRGRWPEAEPTIIQNPQWAYHYACHVIGDRWPEAEPTIMQNPQWAYEYALKVIKGRWPQAEPYIIQDQHYAYQYARFVIDGRWLQAEPTIIQDPKWAYLYACYVIKDRWPKAEPTIMKYPQYAHLYACYVIKGRWLQAEPTIMKSPAWAIDYARDVIKGRWPEAEPTIMKDPHWAYNYAHYVIKGRWPEAEPTIMQNPYYACDYALDIIKGRWPEAEPNIMKEPQQWEQYQLEIKRIKNLYATPQ